MKKVCVLFAEGFEEVEALTVVDLLRRVKIEVLCASVTGNLLVTGAHNITVQMDCLMSEISEEEMDYLILPGGMPGTIHLKEDPQVRQWIQKRATREAGIAAICAAPSILGELGILQGRRATCYPGFESALQGASVSEEPVVRDANIITSRGVGTAIAFAYELVCALCDIDTAEELMRGIVYDGK
ncbi:MAG: DJ-1 family glyoxalase III [Lachnospiraceae bacterium]